MKTRSILIIAIFTALISLVSCNNDDNGVIAVIPEAKEEPKEEPKDEHINQAPGSFDLVTVGNNEIVVDFSATFEWNEAVDPDGDAVTYDFYLAKNGAPFNPIAIDLITPTLNQELSFSDEYQWRVTAKDSLAASSESATFSFSTRNLNPIRRIENQTSFSPRRGHGMVSFQNRLWLFGGESGELVASGLGKKEKDLWYSDNGINWQESIVLAPFGHRSFSTPIVYKEKLYIIGGASSKPGTIGNSEIIDYKNDVWASNNGADWTQVQLNSAFSKRYGHSLVVFKDKIWLYGGVDKDGIYRNDMYSSGDGVSWNLINGNLFNVSARAFTKLVVFNDKLFLIGGRNKDVLFNEIWESENGADWSLVAQGNEVPVNFLFNAFVYRDKLILVDQFIENNIWYSDDAITWKMVEENIQFTKRQASSSVLYNDKIHIIGGLKIENDGTFGELLNDVWVVE